MSGVAHNTSKWYIPKISIILEATVGETSIGKIFMNGRSQAVRLPKQFRLPGTQVRIRRVGNGILLEPIITDIDQWFKAMDAAGGDAPFMPEGREQPTMPEDDPTELFE
jgi:antitoxin VapB